MTVDLAGRWWPTRLACTRCGLDLLDHATPIGPHGVTLTMTGLVVEAARHNRCPRTATNDRESGTRGRRRRAQRGAGTTTPTPR